MEIKGEPVYFENMNEVEVFEVLSNCLKSELNSILKSYQNLPQDNEEANERKDLLNFLMTTKDRDELNKLNIRFEELGCADDKYCEAISSTSVILSRIVVKIIESSEKSIEYLKHVKDLNAAMNGGGNLVNGAGPTSVEQYSDESSWFSQHTASSVPPSVNTADGFLSHSSGHSSTTSKSNFIKLTSDKLKRNNKLSKAVDNIYKRKTKVTNEFDVMNGTDGNENVFVDTHNFGQRIDCEDYEDYDDDGVEEGEEEGEYVSNNRRHNQDEFQEEDENDGEFQNGEEDDEDDEEEEINGGGSGSDANGMYSSNLTRGNNLESRVKLISLIGRDGNKFKSSYLIKKTTINNNRIKGNRKMYFCQSCSFKTVNIFNLKKHLLNHNYQKDSIKCRYCEYYASNSLRIKHHEMLQHSDEYKPINKVESEKKIHSCKMCPYKTNNITQLKKTHLVHHQYQDGFYKCRYCHYYVVSMSHLSTHEMIHPEYENRDANDPKSHSMKVHYCKFCPYKTIKTSALKQHVMNHEYREATFKCRYCDYYILKMKHMRGHEELHNEYVPRD